MMARKRKAAAAAAAAAIASIAMAGCSGSGYDVISQVAETSADAGADTTELESQTEKASGESEKESEKETAAGGGTETGTATSVTLGDRPEYDPSDYVKACDLASLEITLPKKPEVTDADAEEELKKQAISRGYGIGHATVQEGDAVEISYAATEKGAKKAVKEEAGALYYMGTYEEADKALLGEPVGTAVSLGHSFDGAYANAAYAGKDIVFEITILKTEGADTSDGAIEGMTAGLYSTKDGYMDYLKGLLQDTEDMHWEQEASGSIIDAALDACEITGYPEGVMEYDIQRLYVNHCMAAADAGVEFEDYIARFGCDDEKAFSTYVSKDAQGRLEKEMKVAALAWENGIECSIPTAGEYYEGAIPSSKFPAACESILPELQEKIKEEADIRYAD